MKNLFLISALLITLFLSCQQKVNVEKEQEAILKVLLEEGKTLAANDAEGLFNVYIQDETSLRLAGEKIYSGWENIRPLLESYLDYMEGNPDTNARNVKENVVTKVFGNTAWSVCDNIWEWDEDGKGQRSVNRQLTFLEKKQGEWKISTINFIPITNIEKNIATSTKYHLLNPDDIDDMLTENFIGRNEKSRHTWTREQHKEFWSNNPDIATDSIFHQIAQGDWVATRFQREMLWEGKDVVFESMHLKRFEGDRIAEIWEYGDSRQVE